MKEALLFRFAVVCLAVSSGACGNQIDVRRVSAGAGSGGGSVTVAAATGDAGSTSVSAGQGGAGSASVSTGQGGSESCVPKPADPNAGFSPCSSLAALTVSDPVVTDDSGDGKVSPGEGATIQVNLSETQGKGFNDYPGVTFSSDDALIKDPGTAQLYAILPCHVVPVSVHVDIPNGVPVGTVVHVKAQVSTLNQACPGGQAITISIPVE